MDFSILIVPSISLALATFIFFLFKENVEKEEKVEIGICHMCDCRSEFYCPCCKMEWCGYHFYRDSAHIILDSCKKCKERIIKAF